MKQIIKSLAFTFLLTQTSSAAMLVVQNPGFEDTTGQNPYGEFTFGRPTGWQVYDPFEIHPSSGLAIGTLLPNGTEFFNTTAPEGNRVAILYNRSRRGDGEYGYTQVLTNTLLADTLYTLTVQVGNIASGTDLNGTFYNLNGNPGYRVELLAGGSVISSDNNGLTIPEGEFALSTVTFLADGSHPQLGQNLEIRLVNENFLTADPDAFLEIDYDDVQLSAVPVPEPHSAAMLAIASSVILFRRRKQFTPHG
ncbi:MAG: PEP-CTERM sorting domain-containing protein [Akkermansiaceae bacterium]